MKKVILLCITIIMMATACTNKSEVKDVKEEGFYKFELLSSYEECIKILKSKNWEYKVTKLHDKHGNGVVVTVDKIMSIDGKMFSLELDFPDTLRINDRYVNFNSKALVKFSYSARNIDADYGQSFIKYCNKYFGEPKLNQFANEGTKDFDPKLVSWNDKNYDIICVAYLGKNNVNLINIGFGMTRDQEKIALEKFK